MKRLFLVAALSVFLLPGCSKESEPVTATDAAWMEWANRELPKGGLPAPEGSGGGGGFLRFMREEVISLVEQKYRINRNDRAYYGFSFGGLFGTYALLNNEGTFQRFVIGSPSLWWNNRVMFDQEKAYAQTHKTLPARVFFSVGLDEESEYDNTGFRFALVSTLREFVRVLTERHYDGLTIGTHYFEGERHNSVFPGAVTRGLLTVFDRPAPANPTPQPGLAR